VISSLARGSRTWERVHRKVSTGFGAKCANRRAIVAPPEYHGTLGGSQPAARLHETVVCRKLEIRVVYRVGATRDRARSHDVRVDTIGCSPVISG